MKVVGKRVIVTGGASGIGEASARRFIEEGAAVAIVDLDEARGSALAAELSEKGLAIYRRADVTKEAQVKEVVDEIASTFGRIDVLHANAGVARGGTAVEHSEAEWDFVYAVNVKAPWLCAKHTIPHLLAGGGGSIVITGSTSGLLGFPGVIAYTSSKGAVINLTRSLALEHARQGIRVNCVCPGFTRTPFTKGLLSDPVKEAKLLALHPLGRLGEADDIANAIAFLISAEAAWITGQAIAVDGGFTAGHGVDV